MQDDELAGTLLAPAKVNLALHVTGRRADGYHLLETLVVFPRAIADRIEIEPADRDLLTVTGEFREGVPTDRGNIVLKALDLCRAQAGELGIGVPPLSITLEKNLPHGAGIGGGSADAAALLSHLARLDPALGERLASLSAGLGADVPMCMAGSPQVARGIGDELEPVALSAGFGILLVNPRRPVPTPAVFKALVNRSNTPLPAMPPKGFGTTEALLNWLKATRNDLQETAVSIEGAIAEAIGAIEREDALLARMSGSGATVFGLFETPEIARDRAERLRASRPDWWIRAA
ncbi:4-(cytidine 5'-diphospho)-2-C-methyl-D-erythritol kinase [Fulvimarina endophytica]|uniref:4-diphosphocytidyl-2-C-methyl-D-erythritol kinase n=1 Tax=Fulvimarina endophytica TaxID=2293836 RepID=A0A371X254_9HYPH|nr:4-(cytidine 5'-diphospho)-2-C-methyl-D-erythritol kinase [Fulvimarina endophytica]RFC63297.1 4-(cytidine 5'-diphospho)-2-C-methyl-D-erythritol kinase [Fulvimarina endophytica]